MITLVSPTANSYAAPNTSVALRASVNSRFQGGKKIVRVDFRSNGILIASSTNRIWTAAWTPTASGNYSITAEAITLGNTIAYTTAATNFSVLTVLYDKLGEPGNWGFTGQGSYTSYFDDIDQNEDFGVSTFYINSLTLNKTIKSVEVAASYISIFTLENRDMSSLNLCRLKIWDMNLGSFYSNATIPTLASTDLGTINLGSTSSPVESQAIPGGTRLVYHIGWDNLNVNLPANKPLEASIQCGVNPSFGIFGISGSSFPGLSMRSANKTPGGPQVNVDLSQPLAAKIFVY